MSWFSTRHRTVAAVVVATALVLVCRLARVQIQHVAYGEGLRLRHVLMRRQGTCYIGAVRRGVRIEEAVQVVGDAQVTGVVFPAVQAGAGGPMHSGTGAGTGAGLVRVAVV